MPSTLLYTLYTELYAVYNLVWAVCLYNLGL